MGKLKILLCIILSSTNLYSQETWTQTSKHLSYGIPAYQDTLLDRNYFVIAFDRDLKIPEWVAYYITPEILEGTQDRTDNFRADSDLPSDKQASLSDYSGSGFDRGHMAPAADFKRSYDAMSTTFLLTNMSPQTDNLNRYDWAYLEGDVRDLINLKDTTWIFTGYLFLDENYTLTEPDTFIGDSVFIPTHFYKSILTRTVSGNYESYAFVMPNQDFSIPGDPEDYLISVDSLESITGLDFFSKLDDVIENNIESITATEWPVTTTSDNGKEVIPEDYILEQNFPNPFNPETNIKFSLKNPSKVKLKIFNLKGQLVKTLISEFYPAGNHHVKWDGKNQLGKKVSSGVYIYRIKVGSFIETKKMVLIR